MRRLGAIGTHLVIQPTMSPYTASGQNDSAANAVFAVGMLASFVAVLADCFIVFVKNARTPT